MKYFVYLFINEFRVVIYVGKTCDSENVYRRLYEHKTSTRDNCKKAFDEMDYIRFVEVQDEYTMNNLEGLLQNLYQPKYNLRIESYDQSFAPGMIYWSYVNKDDIRASKGIHKNNILKVYHRIEDFVPDGEDLLYAIQYENGLMTEQDFGRLQYVYRYSVPNRMGNKPDGTSKYIDGEKVKYYPAIHCDTDDLFLKTRIILNSDNTYKFKVFASTREACLEKLNDMCDAYLQNETNKLERYKAKIEPRINLYSEIRQKINDVE